jgi:hypothetical protein
MPDCRMCSGCAPLAPWARSRLSERMFRLMFRPMLRQMLGARRCARQARAWGRSNAHPERCRARCPETHPRSKLPPTPMMRCPNAGARCLPIHKAHPQLLRATDRSSRCATRAANAVEDREARIRDEAVRNIPSFACERVPQELSNGRNSSFGSKGNGKFPRGVRMGSWLEPLRRSRRVSQKEARRRRAFHVDRRSAVNCYCKP